MNKYLFLLFFIIAGQSGMAQSGNIKFDHLTVRDGLPSRDGSPEVEINFVQQDDQGYIWIGTPDGLVRYDGYKLKVYPLGVDKDKGVYNNSVYGMISDENKHLWFTVGNNLYRYNRSSDSFTMYKYPNQVWDTMVIPFFYFADGKGNLWEHVTDFSQVKSVISNHVEFENNLVKFDQKNKSYEFFGKTQKGSHHVNITGDNPLFRSATGGRQMWLGTKNGLYLYNEKNDSFYPYLTITDTARQKSVYQVFEAPSEPGILWMNVLDHFSKQYRIERFDTRNKTFKDYSHYTNPRLTASNDTINQIYEDSRRRLWFATANGLMLFNRGTNKFVNYLPADTDREANKNQVGYIAEAKNGTLWLASGKGVLNFNPVTHMFKRYRANPNDPDALSSNEVSGLLVDRSGTIWVSTRGGLNKLNSINSAFTIYTKKSAKGNGYLVDNIQRVTSSTDGYIWFSSDTGIFRWRPGSNLFNKIYVPKKDNTHIYPIAASREGTIYFGNKNGLEVHSPLNHKVETYSHDPGNSASLSSNSVGQIFVDHKGIVWVGTGDKGICTFDPATRKFTRYPYAEDGEEFNNRGKLAHKDVKTIYEDNEGAIWIGTGRGGLSRFDRKTGRFTSYIVGGHTPEDRINKIYEDRDGRLWIGTQYEGLFEFDRKSGRIARNFNEDNGLLYRAATGIIEDAKGFIWVNSGLGLTRLNPRNMSLKTFPLNIILPGKGSGFNNEIFLVNGLMVIGVSDGFAVFNPLDLDNPYPPLVHIEQVSYNNPASTSDSVNTRIAYGLHKMELPYNQNRITLNYVALHFTDPAQNNYAYILEGFDKHWINTTQRSATYTNLSPGTYTFRAKASNSDGIWNNAGDSFIIIIDTPFWLRWWAYLLYIMLFAAAIYAFIFYRSVKLIKEKNALEEQVQIRTEEVLQQKEEIEAQRDRLEMEKIRSDIAADFHDELGSTLSSIALYSEMAISDSSADERTKNILSLIGESSRGTVSAMQDMIWTIQPKNDRMQEVVYRMREYAYPLAELKNIRLIFDAVEAVQLLVLSMDTRKNIYLIFKEALNNAFKYSAATAITISLVKHNDLLELQIKDDGKGFDPSNARAGNGLTNMHKRAVQANGTLSIKSAKGNGTEILFSCPVN